MGKQAGANSNLRTLKTAYETYFPRNNEKSLRAWLTGTDRGMLAYRWLWMTGRERTFNECTRTSKRSLRVPGNDLNVFLKYKTSEEVILKGN